MSLSTRRCFAVCFVFGLCFAFAQEKARAQGLTVQGVRALLVNKTKAQVLSWAGRPADDTLGTENWIYNVPVFDPYTQKYYKSIFILFVYSEYRRTYYVYSVNFREQSTLPDDY